MQEITFEEIIERIENDHFLKDKVDMEFNVGKEIGGAYLFYRDGLFEGMPGVVMREITTMFQDVSCYVSLIHGKIALEILDVDIDITEE